jgi:hypothetical protein
MCACVCVCMCVHISALYRYLPTNVHDNIHATSGNMTMQMLPHHRLPFFRSIHLIPIHCNDAKRPSCLVDAAVDTIRSANQSNARADMRTAQSCLQCTAKDRQERRIVSTTDNTADTTCANQWITVPQGNKESATSAAARSKPRPTSHTYRVPLRCMACVAPENMMT